MYFFFAYAKTHVHLPCFQSTGLPVFLVFSFLSFVFLCYSISYRIKSLRRLHFLKYVLSGRIHLTLFLKRLTLKLYARKFILNKMKYIYTPFTSMF